MRSSRGCFVGETSSASCGPGASRIDEVLRDGGARRARGGVEPQFAAESDPVAGPLCLRLEHELGVDVGDVAKVERASAHFVRSIGMPKWNAVLPADPRARVVETAASVVAEHGTGH